MKLSSVYSPLKIIHHYDRVKELKSGGHPSPILVQLILSDFCNQDCSFCAYRMSGYTSNQNFGVVNKDGSVDNNPKRMIPAPKVLEILYDCKAIGVKAIEFTGGGEPTVHPGFCEVVDYASRQLGLDFSLVTNGVLLTEKVREVLKRATWVRLSLDAGTPDTYAKVRRVGPAMFNKAIHNIDALISERTKEDQIIGVSFVVTHENWREILIAANIAKDIGANYFRIGACFTPENESYYEGIYDEIRDMCEAAASMSNGNFTVVNQFRGRVGDLIQKSPDYVTCGHMHFNTYIGGDLSVYRCCALAYNDRGYLGSLKERSFSDLWFSDSVKEDFAKFDARDCERCPFNEKNRVLEYLLQDNPLHVNFA